MKRLFVPTAAVAVILGLSIPAAAFIFSDAPPAPSALHQRQKVGALSPDGRPVRVIAMTADGTSQSRTEMTAVRPDMATPASTQMAPAQAEIKEMAVPVPVRATRVRKAATNGVPARARPLKLGSLY